MIVYMLSTYSKFEFPHQITESQAFVLVFVMKTTEFLPASDSKTEKDSS